MALFCFHSWRQYASEYRFRESQAGRVQLERRSDQDAVPPPSVLGEKQAQACKWIPMGLEPGWALTVVIIPWKKMSEYLRKKEKCCYIFLFLSFIGTA